MTFVAKPKVHHPNLPLNELGLTRRDYEGSVSTLCAGCGHDSVSAAIVQACAELSLPPHRFAKVSGIGCSSKTLATSSIRVMALTQSTAACLVS